MAETPKGPERYAVVISRTWHKPGIRVSVDDFGIAVSMMLVDFFQALFIEAGCNEEAKASLLAASDRVVAGMKQETERVM